MVGVDIVGEECGRMIIFCLVLWVLGCFNTFLLATAEESYGFWLKIFVSVLWPVQTVLTISILLSITVYEKVTGKVIHF